MAASRKKERRLVAESQKIKLTLSPQAEKYARRDAPVEVRLMAAGGALPLPPIELATTLFVLAHDPHHEVKSRARESHPALLAYLSHVFKDEAHRIECIALNPATDDRTFAFLATLPHKRVIDIAANNQQRMLRFPEIADALGNNPLTGRATIDRILTFLGIERPHAEVPDEEDAGPRLDEREITDAAAAAALTALLGDDASQFCSELVEDRDGELDSVTEGNLFKIVQSMNVMQKVKLARLGNKDARSLLVRDRNKIVAAAAIRSPKITDNEVETYARARNLSEEVLRIIAANREWTRSYRVKLALAMNPKVKVATAMKFLNFLQEKDLRSIMKSKDVPTPIAAHARRLLQKKGKI
jgi:hypothetical protein